MDSNPGFAPEQLKKLREAIEHLAPVVALYHRSLVEGGMNRDEAMALAKDFQQRLMFNAAAAR